MWDEYKTTFKIEGEEYQIKIIDTSEEENIIIILITLYVKDMVLY